jgi:hypothetical protein
MKLEQYDIRLSLNEMNFSIYNFILYFWEKNCCILIYGMLDILKLANIHTYWNPTFNFLIFLVS